MTYKNAYKILEKKGTIDDIIGYECSKGFHVLEVKKDICDGISYYTDFVKTQMFKDMKYWQDDRFVKTESEILHHRIVNRVCKELAEYEIEECKRYIKQCEHLIAVQV